MRRTMGWREARSHREAAEARIVPRRQRQINWLRQAVAINESTNQEAGITLHVEGGVGYNKDLRDLVARGMLVMHRWTYRNWNPYPMSRAKLVITDAGRALLNRGQ